MNTLALIFMILTLIVLVSGVALMIKGGVANRKYSNKLMILRVILQATAVIILLLAYFFGKKS